MQLKLRSIPISKRMDILTIDEDFISRSTSNIVKHLELIIKLRLFKFSVNAWCVGFATGLEFSINVLEIILNCIYNATVFQSFQKLQELLPSQPPMCWPPMKTLGTVRCPDSLARAAWISLPSPKQVHLTSVHTLSATVANLS